MTCVARAGCQVAVSDERFWPPRRYARVPSRHGSCGRTHAPAWRTAALYTGPYTAPGTLHSTCCIPPREHLGAPILCSMSTLRLAAPSTLARQKTNLWKQRLAYVHNSDSIRPFGHPQKHFLRKKTHRTRWSNQNSVKRAPARVACLHPSPPPTPLRRRRPARVYHKSESIGPFWHPLHRVRPKIVHSTHCRYQNLANSAPPSVACVRPPPPGHAGKIRFLA